METYQSKPPGKSKRSFCFDRCTNSKDIMLCPYCHYSETKVVDSRLTQEGKNVRRRRECEQCQTRFSTHEEPDFYRVTVIKKDGHREIFDRMKLRIGLERAFEKRPLGDEKVAYVLRDVERLIRDRGLKDITSREIGRLVMEQLRGVDEVAYIRFLSVYKSFGSAQSFRKAIESLDDEKT